MRLVALTILAAVWLAGCKNEPPPLPPNVRVVERAGGVLAEGKVEPIPQGVERRILAFGDSLFAGYRLGRNQGYPERLQVALRARRINAKVTNAGVSGDTTADGRQRFQFVLDGGPRPDLVIVELGGNDLLRGLPPEQTRANLAAILDVLKARHVPVVLMGMRAPPNMGPEFQHAFDAIYPELAKEYGATLVPFFLEPVYDKPALVQADHIHPTAQGVDALIAASVDAVARALPKAD